ncbi:MAG: regulatory protein RecX [Nocardioides sp.]|uniref:regulatory protein RecX n=1 Tax=Nocardioides sp. TaxID=35761 RepID=UPI0039E3CC27
MTSDPWAGDPLQGDPPDWLGDVSAGVDAWTRRSSSATPAVPEPEQDPEADHEAVARKILLDQLTGQARSRQELAARLARRHVPDEVAGRVLDRFEEVGLVDDAAFARSWVSARGRADGKGLARRVLAQELRRKGVDDEAARAALDEIDPAEEERAARALVRKKLRGMTRLDAITKARRLAGMLARKGYPSGLAFAVVREELRLTDGADLPHSVE